MSKSISHANRGLDFEARVQKKCDILVRDKVLFLSKVPTEFKIIRGVGGKIVNAFAVGESRFVDFIGTYSNGKSLAIECKQTIEKTSFSFNNIKESQFNFFKVWNEFNGLGYYLINWKTHRKLYMIKSMDLVDLRKELIEGVYGKPRKSIPFNMFESDPRFIELNYTKINFEDYIDK